MAPNPLTLTQDLIRCPSVTPEEGGAIALLEDLLSGAGFTCHRADRAGISNLIAVWDSGKAGPFLGFNGHTDVVPIGDIRDWQHDPFGAEIEGDVLFGRGACDMKSGVAAFISAAIAMITDTPPETGGIVITITGDEEGDGVDGTRAILDQMGALNISMDHCIVGEPTCPSEMGEMIKIGRRGSMTSYITATGVQGHSAYPHRARNPIPPLLRYLNLLLMRQLDFGNAHFDPSTLTITGVDAENTANNVIPERCKAMVNIRFNDEHSSAKLSAWMQSLAEEITGETGVRITQDFKISGEAFISEPDAFTDLIAESVTAETGRRPVLSTSGGTSDARFIRNHCPVVECGLVGQTMHQVDERVAIPHIHQQTAIYTRIIAGYFAR